MKTIIKTTIFIAVLFANPIFSQEKNIETHSIEIENFIAYIVENYPNQSEDLYNLTFLIQTGTEGYALEEKVILKQAFKILSKRLHEDNTISMLAYSGLNGVALEQNPIKKMKKMLYVLDNFKSSIKVFHEDGVTLAYDYIKENFNDNAINRIIIVRIPNLKNEATSSVSSVKGEKKKNNAIVLTAISLLPEIISVLKN